MLRKGSVHCFTAHSRPRFSKNVLLGIAVFLFGFALFASAPVVLAQTSEAVGGAAAVARQAGVGSANLYVIVGRVIYAFLAALGLVVLGYLIYAGYLWMTAGGEAEKTAEARRMIQNAIIGLVIIASSFAITAFILSRLDSAFLGGQGGEAGGPVAGLSFPSAAGALGNGIIESHLPVRDATGVPRNTSIIITFKEPMKLASLIQGYDDRGTPADLSDDVTASALNVGTVHIIKLNGTREETLTSAQVDVRFTEDRKTFVFKPREWLGSSTANTPYRVELVPGRSGLLVESGQSAFSSEFPSGYRWQFEVSTLVDVTPPQIISVLPPRGVQPPNAILQINFNEAIDPTSAAGLFRAGRGFSNIEVNAAPTGDPEAAAIRVPGQFVVSNGYQTVEFIPDEACGQNACGREVRCLPRASTIAVLAKSASLSAEPPQARVVSTAGGGSIFDGIVDTASNSLDGSGDGESDGPPGDNRGFSFGTSGEVVLTAPRIGRTNPPVGLAAYPAGASNMSPDHVPQAVFGVSADDVLSNVLQGSTVNSRNVYMTRANEPTEISADTFWFTPVLDVLAASGEVVTGEDPAAFGRIGIRHRFYARPTRPVAGAPAGPIPPTPVYAPVITSGVQNLLQNCFKPSGSVTCSATLGGGGVPGLPTCCNDRTQAGDCSFSRRTP